MATSTKRLAVSRVKECAAPLQGFDVVNFVAGFPAPLATPPVAVKNPQPEPIPTGIPPTMPWH